MFGLNEAPMLLRLSGISHSALRVIRRPFIQPLNGTGAWDAVRSRRHISSFIVVCLLKSLDSKQNNQSEQLTLASGSSLLGIIWGSHLCVELRADRARGEGKIP